MDRRDMIKEHMPVIDADGQEFATVDHLDVGNSIKLTRDDSGNHHWIPLDWVERVDEHVHLGRAAAEVREEWLSEEPADI